MVTQNTLRAEHKIFCYKKKFKSWTVVYLKKMPKTDQMPDLTLDARIYISMSPSIKLLWLVLHLARLHLLCSCLAFFNQPLIWAAVDLNKCLKQINFTPYVRTYILQLPPTLSSMVIIASSIDASCTVLV